MAEEKSEGAGSLLANPSALLALITIAGGMWLVSQKLTSDRPVTPAGGTAAFISDQKFEARLWEDPFKDIVIGDHKYAFGLDAPTAIGMSALAEQIGKRVPSPEKAGADQAAARLLLLPVMLSGGHYNEDTESRIRSRFAIISALGRSGYVPEDAEHIGTMMVPWLTQAEIQLARARKKPEGAALGIAQLWGQTGEEKGAKGQLLGIELSEQSPQMEVRYEWFRPRVFSAGASVHHYRPRVLVLWLDESYFDDVPLLRLPLFLEQLVDQPALPPERRPEVALIGPRRSSTLRAMLPEWQSKESTLPSDSILTPLAKQWLGHIDLYCATPSAMDEVLVRDPRPATAHPRATLGDALVKEGFRSFHNFSATDAQMSREIFEELALRGVDLANEKNHVVLISEWDTFYARMLSLTYGAELTVFQQGASHVAAALNRGQFVDLYITAAESPSKLPANFHSYVYLRGLDGQTVGGNGEAGDAKRRSDRAGPNSIEELRHWAPDVNKAEGQAQFDYLGRLGDQLDDLQTELRQKKTGQISAIGIVGSDVYDTLLILQALRQRFPAVLFFTTDLDVRFLHPNERDWARNLIVASSYGLALHPALQADVAPFRDSAQTAQFAAALAALGNTDLAAMVEISPRRFEVGNRTAVDISVKSSAQIHTDSNRDKPGPPWLHPLTVSELSQDQPAFDLPRLSWALLAGCLLLIGASRWWGQLRRLTWEALAFPRLALDYSEEDLGGEDGVVALWPWLAQQDKVPFARWLVTHKPTSDLWEEFKRWNEKLLATKRTLVGIEEESLTASLESLPDNEDRKRLLIDLQAKSTVKREKIISELTGTLVRRVNQYLREEVPAELPERLPSVPSGAGQFMGSVVFVLRFFPGTHRLIRHYHARQSLDYFLDSVVLLNAVEADAPHVSASKAGLLKMVRREMYQLYEVVLGEEAPSEFTCGDATLLAGKQQASKLAEQLAGAAARDAGRRLFLLRCRRLVSFMSGVVASGLCISLMVWAIWSDTFRHASGEQFSLSSGTSAWPAEIIRLLVFGLALCFGFSLSFEMREAFLGVTRDFRLSPPVKNAVSSTDRVCAQSLWYEYREGCRFRARWPYLLLVTALYVMLLMAFMKAAGASVLNPFRGPLITELNNWLIWAAFLGFLALAFLTMDASSQCREFIEKLSATQTLYPDATRRYFSREKGEIDMEYLDEWIDVKLIADLTEKVGQLVYYPAGLFVLLLLARNSWWDNWAWSLPIIIIFACNFALSLASVVILQRAAQEAKRKAEQTLSAKVKRLQAQAAPSVVQNDASQAEKLLEEIRSLHRGAFVPFWQNPVVGALFLSSGGTTLLQMMIWFMGR